MAQYTVIADVGITIVQLLRDNMVNEPIQQPEFIGLSHPNDKGDLSLSLFLYSVKESADRQTQMLSRGQSTLQYPPLTVELFYMLTAHSAAELQTRALDEQRILGKALQVLYDNSIIKGQALQGSLADTNEELRIVMENLPLDTLISLFPNSPYKLSVCFSVGPVYIDSTRIKATKRVVERDISITG
ncbi:DUF4255 domain-containing protein [Paenibacillus psychroresistens]|uniref:DUF4255 domain-containing protein n=1 Tax=Paenibacillus psychroresistens TaxID=1778678 RepID=A0A6B8RX22_9BACL|nr:DUF4255 domain-containing protein [Paenibacillus psychroresistens]